MADQFPNREKEVKAGDQTSGTTPGKSGHMAQAKIDAPGGFSLTLPLPTWAVGVLALMLILGLVLVGSFLGYSRFSGRVLVPRESVEDYNETTKHELEPETTKETKELTFDDGVKVTVKHFHTDGCVEVLRTSQSLFTDKHWLRDLSKVQPPPTQGAALFHELGPEQAQSASMLASFELFHPLNAKKASTPTHSVVPLLTFTAARAPACNRKCLNPHPGNFQSSNGTVNGCWLQVWRRWTDGCAHYQWYNTCHNFWDNNPDGSPKVTWTCCVHD
jgi:hypothetical protein